MDDVLVLGGGPAALCIASELKQRGVAVSGIAADPIDDPWPNTYGIWAKELEQLDLANLLEHRWSDTISFFGSGGSAQEDQPIPHQLDYGLFNRSALQRYWLKRCGEMTWHVDRAHQIDVGQDDTKVTCASGQSHVARLVIDASGHRSTHLQRPNHGPVAGQAAYGVVARFNRPPIASGQFVLMDFRSDHLTAEQRREPPTFLYAMDLGQDLFFVEETSLALAPPVAQEVLQQRLQQRLTHRGVAITAVEHEEHCLFPMNLPLPDLQQPVLAFGGAASMVHPASGYMVGALLRRGPGLAEAIASALAVEPRLGSAALAREGWRTLWSPELVWRHRLFQFGLNRLMGFNQALLRRFFSSFFSLSQQDWSGFLTNTLPLPRLMALMLRLFLVSPWDVRRGLVCGAPKSQAPVPWPSNGTTSPGSPV